MQRAFANAPVAVDTVVVAADTQLRRIGVVGIVLDNAGALAATVVVNSKGSGAGTAISATFGVAIGGGIVMPPIAHDGCWLLTNPGEALTVTVTGAAAAVQVIYKYLP